jgi:hypothetical protein
MLIGIASCILRAHGGGKQQLARIGQQIAKLAVAEARLAKVIAVTDDVDALVPS